MVVVADDETILFDGRSLAGQDEVASALKAILEHVPINLAIALQPTEHY